MLSELISPDLLTPKLASGLYRVRPQTLRTWGDTGVITVVRTPGGHRRYVPIPGIDPAELLYGREVAEALNVATKTVQVWTISGHLRRVRFDDHSTSRYRVGDVVRCLTGSCGRDHPARKVADPDEARAIVLRARRG